MDWSPAVHITDPISLPPVRQSNKPAVTPYLVANLTCVASTPNFCPALPPATSISGQGLWNESQTSLCPPLSQALEAGCGDLSWARGLGNSWSPSAEDPGTQSSGLPGVCPPACSHQLQSQLAPACRRMRHWGPLWMKVSKTEWSYCHPGGSDCLLQTNPQSRIPGKSISLNTRKSS